MSKRLRLISLSALATACVALAIPAIALALNTTVVPFKTVAGLPLKVTPAQVLKRLGKPTQVIRLGGVIAAYDYRNLALSFNFDTLHHPDEADYVGVNVGPATPDIDYHTIDGIHIGSSEAATKRAFSWCHIKLGQCEMWHGTPGADGSTAFALLFEGGKVSSMVNQVVLKDQ